MVNSTNRMLVTQKELKTKSVMATRMMPKITINSSHQVRVIINSTNRMLVAQKERKIIKSCKLSTKINKSEPSNKNPS